MRNVLRLGAVRGVLLAGLLAAAPLGSALAVEFTMPSLFSDQPINGVLNTTFTVGGGVRIKSPSENILAKSNLNPGVCGGPNGAYQICQGLFKDQIYPSRILVAAPGAASMNGDQGDLNYHRYRFFSAPAKVTSDLTLTYGDFGFFARALYFYDFVNNDFSETHPNEITPQNDVQVGRHVPAFNPVTALVGGLTPSQITTCLGSLQGSLTGLVGTGQLVLDPSCATTQTLEGALLNNRNYGRPDGAGNFVVYGAGGKVRSKRTDGTTLAQVGTNMQYLDSYFYGKLPIPFTEDKKLSFKIGRQLVNWGESTTLAINSINQANPVNANNVYRIGGQVEEFFTPINQIDISFEPIEGGTVEAFYQLEWQPLEVPTPGSYFSFLPVGTSNVGSSVNASFGQSALDPNKLGVPQDNPLAGLTKSSATIDRLPDWLPRTSGQYGIKLDYYADTLNNGTDISLYYMHYHSRLPYASFFATYPSCARSSVNSKGYPIKGNNNAVGGDSSNSAEFLLDCADIPLVHALTHTGAAAYATNATSDALPIDTSRIVLEYPQDINLIGLSMNTTFGSWSVQGEVAYRPNLPLQVDTHDLAFAAFGPTLSNCQQITCSGTVGGVGFTQSGGIANYGSSDVGNGSARTDTYDLLVGAFPGSARSFPNFIIPYRGGQTGENPACYPQPGSAEDAAYGFNKFSHPYYNYDHNSPCYIKGYERFQVFQFNLGTTRVLGATDNPFGADQVLLLGEFGLEYVPFLPPLDRLVLQGSNTNYGPTAGADGSGATNISMGCAGSRECALSPDGLRFNPHQQDPSAYPSSVSYGYRIISQIRYESLFPNVNLRPFFIWKQDIGGISPGPGGNFVKGAKELDSLFEFQIKQSLAVTLGYTWYWGGGAYNVYQDRDFAQFFVKYQF